jgi:hypothetical protein
MPVSVGILEELRHHLGV